MAPPLKKVEASPQLEAFYQDAMKAVQAVMAEHEKRGANIRTIEVIACLCRAAGYAIGMCEPNARDLVRALAIENMDKGTQAVEEARGERRT